MNNFSADLADARDIGASRPFGELCGGRRRLTLDFPPPK